MQPAFMAQFLYFLRVRKIFGVRWRNSDIRLFRERLSEKNVHATIPEGNMGYDQCTFPNDRSCRTYFGYFPLAIANITSQTSRTILSNFFEEQCTQTHPQCLSGLSRAHFPTTFLEIAVYRCDCKCRCGSVSSAYLLFMK